MGIKRILTTTLLCLCFAIAAEAQNAATVKSFTQTTDHVPVNDRRSDFNGSPCALVKVQVVDQIERVEGNKIGDIVNRGVEKWVYMCKGSRNMKIHLKNHLPVRVMFQDYQINGLESNRVYELVLATSTIVEQEMTRGTFELNISPQTATVTIGGENMQNQVYHPKNDGKLTVVLPYGRYYYTVQAEGYRDYEGNFFVSDNDQTENVNLSPIIENNLSITCSTANVDFIIDGNKVDKKKSATSWTGHVSVGEHVVEARSNGYITQNKTINVPANQTLMVTFDKLKTEAEQKAENIKIERENKQQIEAQQKVKPDATNHPQKTQHKEAAKNVIFGLRAGVNLASLGGADGDYSIKTGFHAGPSVDFRLSNSLYLNTALLFSQKGYKYEHEIYFGGSLCDISGETTAQFVSLPIQLSYRIGMFQLNAGPYLDYGVGGEIDSSYETFDYYGALNYGVTAGVGLTIAQHLYISANYEASFSDYANRNIAISFGYNF